MLGTDIKEKLKSHVLITPTHKECDLSNWTLVESFFKKIRSFDIAINCAAFTQVDKCETEATSTAFQINGEGPHILAKCCEKAKTPLLHISTDYVFDGNKTVYKTGDPPNPQTIYGRSKLLGEQYIQSIMSRYFIVRTSWLYGKNGNNFVKTILKNARNDGPLRVVDDQRGCPTWTKDLANGIAELIQTEKFGIHHASGNGSCTWYEFGKKILATANINKEILPISTKKSFELFPNIKAKRPASSILVNTIDMRDWKEALNEYVQFNA